MMCIRLVNCSTTCDSTHTTCNQKMHLTPWSSANIAVSCLRNCKVTVNSLRVVELNTLVGSFVAKIKKSYTIDLKIYLFSWLCKPRKKKQNKKKAKYITTNIITIGTFCTQFRFTRELASSFAQDGCSSFHALSLPKSTLHTYWTVCMQSGRYNPKRLSTYIGMKIFTYLTCLHLYFFIPWSLIRVSPHLSGT